VTRLTAEARADAAEIATRGAPALPDKPSMAVLP
jgi:hypothetical protein